MRPAEVERQRKRIMRAPLVVRDREYAFFEYVIAYKTGSSDPNLGIMAKVSSHQWSSASERKLRTSIPALGAVHFGRSLSQRGCNVFTRRGLGWYFHLLHIGYTSCVHSVCCVFSPSFSMGCTLGFCLVALMSQNHTEAAACNSENKAKRCGSLFAHGIKISFGEFALQRWIITVIIPIKKINGGSTDRCSRACMSVVSTNGGSTILVDAFCEYRGSRYRQKLIDYTSFDLRLFLGCLQRTTSSLFGNLDRLA